MVPHFEGFISCQHVKLTYSKDTDENLCEIWSSTNNFDLIVFLFKKILQAYTVSSLCIDTPGKKLGKQQTLVSVNLFTKWKRKSNEDIILIVQCNHNNNIANKWSNSGEGGRNLSCNQWVVGFSVHLCHCFLGQDTCTSPTLPAGGS